MGTYETADLWLKMRHAFGHNQPGPTHSELNLRAFMDELERFIDGKIKEAEVRQVYRRAAGTRRQKEVK